MSRLLEQSAIREIAIEIARGNICYIHKISAKITTIDQSIEDPKMIAAQEKKQATLERDIKKYLKIENLSKQEQWVIMKDFLDDINDKSVRKQFSNALNRKNPIRNFHQAIESDMELSLHWKSFNLSEYEAWIANFVVNAYNY
ncbi:MAG: hypothetical protein ACI9XO_004884 [Paraglaciecola sp.]|jgi:hypothetical protein